MRSPLVVFFIIGSILFAADYFSSQEKPTIVVDAALKTQLAGLWQAQMEREPSASEMNSIVDNWLKDEVFYQEALRLNLDQDDTIVRRRMIQKLGFLLQDVDQNPLQLEDLRAYYEQHREDYQLPQRYSLSQVYLADEPALAKKHRAALSATAAETDWRSLGKTSMLPRSVVSKTKRELAATFGNALVRSLDQLQLQQWVGPIESSFGYHMIRLDAEFPEQTAAFESVQQAVLSDAETAREAAKLRAFYQSLTEQYQIEYK